MKKLEAYVDKLIAGLKRDTERAKSNGASGEQLIEKVTSMTVSKLTPESKMILSSAYNMMMEHTLAEDYFTDCGLLRFDLRSDFEKADVIESIVSLILKDAFELFNCSMIATKAIPIAVERIRGLLKLGFDSSKEKLIGHDGSEYGDYFVRFR